MKPCPSCDSRIGFKNLALSVPPVWITCPECRSALVGRNLVHWIAFIQILLIAATFVAVGVFIVAASSLYSEDFALILGGTRPAIGLVISTAIITILVSVIIIWPAGILLIWKFGRYVATPDGQRVVPGFRRYILATGVVSIVVLSWAIIYAGYNPITIAALVSWVFVPFLLLYRFYDIRLGNRSGRSVLFVLLVWAGIFNLSALFFAVYAGANFPKTPAFQEQLSYPSGTEAQYAAWYQFRDLTRAEDPDGGAILAFLADNVVSVPEKEVDFRAEVPRISPILAGKDSELDEIRSLLERKKESDAEERYLRVWRAADNMITGSGTLIEHLVALGLISNLIDFQIGEETGPPMRPNAELLEITARINGNLDRSFGDAMALEYQARKSALFVFAGAGCLRPSSICLFEVEWPFLDKYQVLKEDHDRTLAIVMASRPPYTQQEDAPADRNAVDDYDEVKVSILKNPIGSVLRAVLIPVTGKFARQGLDIKGRLAIFNYAMEYRLSGALGDPPIDLVTGEPFNVADKGDTVEVTSKRKSTDGEPVVRYQFPKNVP